MIAKIAALLGKHIDGNRARKYVQNIYEIDRFFSFRHMYMSARYVARELKKMGLKQVEIVDCPADGKSIIGDFTANMAWDAWGGTLDVVGPNKKKERFVDYKKLPCGVIMYSAPTKGPVNTQLVYVPDAGKLSSEQKANLKGKLLMGVGKAFAVEHGALGIIEQGSSRPEQGDAVKWVNKFSDKSGMWGFTAEDTPLVGLSISRNQANKLIAWTNNGQKPLRCTVNVKTRLYEGTFPTISGIIPGTDPQAEEVVFTGHLYEPGASDNASGCGLRLELARIFQELIKKKKLARPRRTVRFMFTFEGPGSAAWLEQRPDLARKILAAIELDCVGHPRHLGRTPEGLNLSVHGVPSCLDAIAIRTIRGHIHSQRGPGWNLWETPDFVIRQEGGIDSRIVTALSRGGAMRVCAINYVWHSSADTMDLVCPQALAYVGVLCGTVGLVLAMAGNKEAHEIARLSFFYAMENLAQQAQSEVERMQAALTKPKKLAALRDGIRQLRFILTWQSGIVRSTERLANKQGKPAQQALCRKLCRQLTDAEQRFQKLLGDTAGITGRRQPPNPKLTASEQKLKNIKPVFHPPIFKLRRLPAKLRNGIGAYHVWGISDFADGKRNLLEILEMLARSYRREETPTQSVQEIAKLISPQFSLVRVMEILKQYGYVSY